MFCDGKCKKGNKRCGLLIDITLENRKTGDVRTEEQCTFTAMYASLSRLETKQDGLHSAMNSTRNETVAILSKGFMTMIGQAQKYNELLERDLEKPIYLQGGTE